MDLFYTYSCCGKKQKWTGTKKAYNQKVKKNRKCSVCSKIKNENENCFFKKDKSGRNRKYIIYNCINCKKDIETRYYCFKKNKTKMCNKCMPLFNDHLFEKTHGISNHPIYKSWSCMKNRCLNKKHDKYHRYGGRGISICNEWMDIINFYEWSINNGWSNGLEIDRINNNGNYEPNNCRWITHKENCNNK